MSSSGLVVSSIWLLAHVTRASDTFDPSFLFGLVVLFLDLFLLLGITVAFHRIRRRFGSPFAAGSSLFIWSTAVLFSYLVHRASDDRLIDHLASLLTFGLWPGSSTVAGQAMGPIMLGAMLANVLVALSGARISENARIEVRPGWIRGWDIFTARDVIVGLSSIGLIAFGQSIFDLYARQHVERIVVDPATGAVDRLTGPVLPIFLWTAISAGMLGLFVALPLVIAVHMYRRRRVICSRGQELGEAKPDFPVLLASFWILALGFWVRIASLLLVAPTRTDGGDPLFYHVTANLLAQGRGLPEPLNFIAFQRWIPSALHGPAYPIVLSISSRIGGSTYFDHKFFSILIGTAVVAMTMLLARLVVPDRFRTTSVLLAGFLSAVYPNLWLVDGVLFPEGLMALFTLGVVYCSYKWWAATSMKWALSMGALIAAAALTRGEGLLLSVLIVLPLTLAARDLPMKRRLVHLAAAALACLIVLAPWAVRNARSFEVFVPLSTNGNELFVYANCPPVYEGKFLGFWLFQCQEDLRAESGEPEGDEAEKSLHWRRIGLDYARENLDDLPRVLAARVGRQWDFFRPWQNTEFAPIEGRDKDSARIGLFMYYAMIPAAVVGVMTMKRRRVRLLPIGAVFASVTLTAAYAYGTTRFRVPAEPLLCLLAGIGGAVIVDKVRSRWPASDDNVRINLLGPSDSHSTFVQGSAIEPRNAFRRSSVPTWATYGLVAAAIAVTLPALYRAVGSSMEEGFMLVFPELVMKGLVPNVDFLHLYGPGSLHALAVWFEVFDVSLVSERTFGLLQHLLFVSALMLILRPWGRFVAVLVGLSSLLFVLTPIGLQALAWNGALGLGMWSLVLALRAQRLGTRVTWLLAGCFAGLSLTFRPDLILALVLPLSLILWREHKRVIVSFASGAIIGLLPIWWHLLRAGFSAVFEGMFLDPVLRLRGGRVLPRPPSLDRLDGALQVISEKFAPWWGFPHLSAPKQLFLWFFLLPLITAVVFMVAKSMASQRRERHILMVASLFAIGLLPQAFQRPDSAHFLWVSAVAFPLVIVAGIELARRKFPRTHPHAHAAIAGLGLFSIIFLLLPFYTVRSYADLAVRSVTGDTAVREVRRGDRVFYLGDERPWRASLEVISDLDGLIRPGERLFVGPVDLRQTAYSDVFFYHLFPELVPATYYIEMDPGLANEDPRLAQDVASSDWLILTRFWSGWIEPNDSILFGSDLPNQVVEESFCLVRSYQNDLIRLFQRCGVGDGIGPYEGPYRPEHDYAVEVLVPVPPRPDGTCTPTCFGRPSKSGVEIGIDTSVLE